MAVPCRNSDHSRAWTPDAAPQRGIETVHGTNLAAIWRTNRTNANKNCMARSLQTDHPFALPIRVEDESKTAADRLFVPALN
jgi:hypothetical protein